MLGSIIGDIAGSIYEFNNHRSKQFEFFGEDVDFTDDTVCTIAVADALLNDRDPAEALRDWCARYPDRGYGSMFRHWLSSRDSRPYGSFGNGAAMRVSPAALLATSLEDALAKAHAVTVVTHNHPEGLKGAAATTHAIWLARSGKDPQHIRSAIHSAYGYDLDRTVDSIRSNYYFNETCQETVPEALICALEATDFEDVIRNAISIGGDSDTVAAIAGGLAEALFGLPYEIRQGAESRLPEEMKALLEKLYAQSDKTARLSND